MSTGQASSHAPQGLMGFVHRRRRGAELVLLILSLVVGIGAYAAVGLGVDGTLPVNLFTYGAWLAGLVIACHVVIRIFAAYADPILLPIVSALNGIGLAMIHRIDLARQASRPSSNGFADAQLIWMTLGRDPLRRGADRRPRPPPPAVLHLHLRARRHRAAAPAAAARHRPDHQRLPHLDPPRADELPARRGRQGAARDRVRGLPRAAPRRPRPGRPPVPVRRPAPRPRPRADPRHVAGLAGHPGLPARPRLLAAVLRAVPGDALRRHRAPRLAGRRWRHVRGRRLRRLRRAGPRARPRRGLAAPVQPGRELLPARAGPLRHGLGRPGRSRARPGPAAGDPARLVRLHPALAGRGARAHRRDGDHPALRDPRGARPAHRPDLPRQLRQADGHRSGHRARAPGLRGDRRRHPADPADRPDHAVPVPGRLQPGRQLGDHRVADPHLRPGAPPTARAGRARRGLRRRRHPGGEDPR